MPLNKRHVLMIGVGAFGHLTPLLELAKKLADHHHITFALTASIVPRMIDAELIPMATEPPVTIIGLVDGYIEDPSDSQMVELAKFNAFVESGTLDLFKVIRIPCTKRNSTSSSESPITLPVDAVIADDMAAPALFYLHEIGVPFYSFNTGATGRMLHYLSITANSPTVADDQPEKMSFLAVPAVGQHPPPVTGTIKKCLLAMQLIVPLVKGIIANTVYELESDLIESAKIHPDLKGIDLFNVGPLAPKTTPGATQRELHERLKPGWMDRRTEA